VVNTAIYSLNCYNYSPVSYNLHRQNYSPANYRILHRLKEEDMFKDIRRNDRKLPLEEGKRILEEGLYGVLSTVGEDGYPYGVPVNYVFDDYRLYFHCAPCGSKIDNLLFNSKVSFCVVGRAEILPEEFSTSYSSVVVFGIASLVEEPSEKLMVLERLIGKYAPDFAEEGRKESEESLSSTLIVRVDIQHITTKGREVK